jgi:membrane protease YdiL (CAAX protease family)
LKVSPVVSTTSPAFSLRQEHSPVRGLAELSAGFLAIMIVLWLPTHEQLIFGPVALLMPAVLVLIDKPAPQELGFGFRQFFRALWILPAAIGLSALGIYLAQLAGTYHALYKADLTHVGGYVLWTIYQQFLLQDYFMPRLTRILSNDAAIAIAAVLFSIAHLPNVPLTIATLVWGAVSCALFRRYRSIYVLGLAQGLLGLCFAVCVPDVFLHHMRVGLGYWHYHPEVVDPQATVHSFAGK